MGLIVGDADLIDHSIDIGTGREEVIGAAIEKGPRNIADGAPLLEGWHRNLLELDCVFDCFDVGK